MPTYEYRCLSCDHQFERFQRMSDEPVKECEVCGQPVKRVLFPVAVHFKGSGFYSTDYGRQSKLGTAGTPSGNGGNGASAEASEAQGVGAGEPGDGPGAKVEESVKSAAASADTKGD